MFKELSKREEKENQMDQMQLKQRQKKIENDYLKTKVI